MKKDYKDISPESEPIDYTKSPIYQTHVRIIEAVIKDMYNNNQIGPEEFHVICNKIIKTLQEKQKENECWDSLNNSSSA